MRIATISALGLILAGGSAWAQSGYNERDRSDSYSYQDQSNRGSGGGYRHHWERGGVQDRDRGHNADHSSDGKKFHARGASLYLKSGDKEFRVDCGDDDSTRECVDAAMVMFREIHSGAATTSGSTPGASTPTSPGATPGAGPGASGGAPTGR